jgi:pimeloyl-ACP methyl ester carboxylesterase
VPPPDLAGIQAPVLLIHGRYDRMVAFEVSIAILNHIADWLRNNCGHWPPSEWTAQVLAFLLGCRAARLVYSAILAERDMPLEDAIRC